MLTLRSEGAELDVLPEQGAGLGGFRVPNAHGLADVLREPRDVDPRSPFGSKLLVPWSNRVSGGGFAWDGAFHPLEPNVEGAKFPIHGNAFGLPWEIETRSDDAITMSLSSDGPGPYRYRARVSYGLSGGRLDQRLEVVNAGEAELPFGLGFHPWFRRAADTLLTAPAGRAWLEDGDHLPSGWCSPEEAGFDYRLAAPLPEGRVNNLFTLWDGRARIEWPDAGLAADIAASSSLGGYILFSPGPESGFFCLEPVSHAVDAHNAAPHWPQDLGPHGGLVPLAPGEALKGSMSIDVAPLQPGD